MSTILGLHFGHDGTACVVKDGRLVSALSSERLTRGKKSGGVPRNVMDAVLAQACVKLEQVDAVAMTDWYSPWSHGTATCYAVGDRFTNESGFPVLPGEPIHDSWNRIWDDEVWEMEVEIGGRRLPGYNVGHQKAHCAAAFYTSPYENAWCISMDASGGELKNNFMVARGSGKTLTYHQTLVCMAGVAYGHFCDQLAIGAQIFKAGAMMALAGYGKVADHVSLRRTCFAGDCFFEPNGDYHKWMGSLWRDLSGGRQFTHETSDGEQAQNIAATMQFIFEQAILKAANDIPDDGVNALCLGGGSFLNCNANSAVRRETRFKDLHLFPACSDDGCAVGAALYVAHAIMGERRTRYKPQETVYIGPERTDEVEPDYWRIAKAISEGKIVGWYQGRAEIGPRALGHRSLLADPRTIESRHRINNEIKHREWYRPLSPSVIADQCGKWFDQQNPSPFMLFTSQALQPEAVPAVLHVDGSARVQTVTPTSNPRFYRLISAFRNITGVPMLLNTSLNGSGEPLLERLEDCERFWNDKPVDMMVVGSEIWER